ncbi:translocation/assembly module TamB domain-containing protein [Candidatus Synechococcus spongiarum]|uniref:DNA polymerase III alpha subunit n=1 Tax=Candidatus Synechococcus spongiarum TaxID=431041 RepID=A0A165B0U9_9SYNE|nr:translocation/assembly module TamB domain-containing protein [Candidatus Synechococcus spongiarum]SAY38809.1 DNA polymerase III alpha subunit (EC 2.7.7.7) [Candidatus Synechococcus spongiarum]
MGIRFWLHLCARRLQRPIEAMLIVAVALLLGWLATDQALGRIYRGLRPDLEEDYSRALGRPLKLGPYRGLRWGGLHVGPSEILPSKVDLTQLAADGLILFVDPWASLQQRRWVIHLHVQALQADWRRNAQGNLWTPPTRQGQSSMPVELWLHARDPAQFRLWWQPVDADATPAPDLMGAFVGRVAFGHHQHGMVIKGRLDLASQGGTLSLDSHGIPLGESWSAQGVARGIRLDDLSPLLLAGTPGAGLSGQVDGDVTVRNWNSQDGACRGAVVLNNLQLPLQGMDPTGELATLHADPLSLRCDGRRLRLLPGTFNMGTLAGQVQGSLGLDQHLDLQASVSGPLPPPLASLGGTATADLRLLGPLTAPESRIQLTITDWHGPSHAADVAVDSRPFPTLTAQLTSHWRSDGDQPQLRASLQAQAGNSQVVMAGQLTPTLQLQSSTINLQPRDWLKADFWPDQPYIGSLTVAQPGATPEMHLQLRNPQLQQDFTLQLAEEVLRVNGSLELATGQQLGITGQATGGQWRLGATLAAMDVAPVLDRVLTLPLASSPLSVTATARGRYGDSPSPDSGQDGPFQLEQALLTARLPKGIGTAAASLLPGPARLQLRTTAQEQWSLQVEAPRMHSHGVVDWWPGRSWQEAGLDLSLALEDVDLAPLGLLNGTLTMAGQVGGSLAQPRFDGELTLANLGMALIRSPEGWHGTIESLSDGHGLQLAARRQDPASAELVSTLDVRVDSAFRLKDLKFRAGDGHLDVTPTEEGYRWMAQDLSLSWLRLVGEDEQDTAHGVELAGVLQGEGEVSLLPGRIHGDMTIDGPRWGPLRGHRLDLNLAQEGHRLKLDGRLLTDPTQGQLAVAAQIDRQPGTPQPWSIHGSLDGVPLGTLRQSVALTRELLQGIRTQVGSSRDLATLTIGMPGETLAMQLHHLAMAQEHLQSLDALLAQTNGRQLPNLEGQLHGDVHIHGGAHQPVWAAVRTDLHLWLVDDGVNHALAHNYEPFHLRMEGPLQGSGAGTFEFSSLPLKLLNLLANLQLPWQGSLAGQGQYQDLFGQRLVSLTLDLQAGQFHGHAVQLEQPASLRLEGTTVAVELTLQTTNATSLLTINGRMNLVGGEEALQLHLSAGNEVMATLSSLSDGTLSWVRGDADATVMIRGPLQQPVLNGYLHLREVEGRMADIPIHHLNSVMLFDQNNLFIEELGATVGEAGSISASGYLGIIQSLATDDPLTVQLQDVDIITANAQFMASGELVLHGSVQDPGLGGRLQISRGVVRASGNGETSAMAATSAVGSTANHGDGLPSHPVEDLLRNWNWQEPLELADLDDISQLKRSLLQAMAQLPPIHLQSLTVQLGPELMLEASTVANFSIAGQVRLSGSIGPDLQPVGLVEFLQGRVNLFTSQFRLDPDARNVALFTPSGGLIPYLDVAMWSQEADTSQEQGRNLSTISAAEITGNATAFDQLNLVQIQAMVEGPADDFPDTLRLQSKPPRSQEELVDLIGGNSVNRLVQGNTNSRLFSVVGQPLLEPVLGRVSHALGRRVIFDVTPTSFTPPPDGDNQQGTPKFVLVGEVGLNLSDRVDVTVLGALNRKDLPPQAKLSFQLTPSLATEITAERDGYVKGVLQLSSRF